MKNRWQRRKDRKAEEYRSLLVGGITIDQYDHVLAWDQGAEKLFGWTEGEVIGAILADFMVPPDLVMEHRARAIRWRIGDTDDWVLGREIVSRVLHKSGVVLGTRQVMSRVGRNFVISIRCDYEFCVVFTPFGAVELNTRKDVKYSPLFLSPDQAIHHERIAKQTNEEAEE